MSRIQIVLLTLLITVGVGVNAAEIVGGSSLMTAGQANQIEAWYGSPVRFTKIFTSTPGDGTNSYSFHAAADGRGPTLVLYEILTSNGTFSAVIGGYNPLSWASGRWVQSCGWSCSSVCGWWRRYCCGPYSCWNVWQGFYNEAYSGTAFLVNLTTNTLQRQRPDMPWQTYNWEGYGPTFGGGHDIWVNNTLRDGYVNAHSYSTSLNILNSPGYTPNVRFGRMEVFTVAPNAKQPQTISFAPLPDRTWGDGDFTVHATGGASGNPVTFSSSGACSVTGSSVHLDGAGSCTITASQAGSASYEPAQPVSRTFSIAKAPLTVTADDASRVYGDPNPEWSGSIAGVVNGDPISASYSTAATPASSVGAYSIAPAVSGPVSNYAVTLVEGELTISQRHLQVTADAAGKVYGDTDPAFSYQITGGSLFGGDALSGTLSRVTGENVGAYPITQGTLSAGANYSIAFVSANLTIDPRPISVAADPQSKTYGDADPALTYTVTGSLVGSDGFGGALTRAAGEDVGSYAIAQGTLALSSNYALSFSGSSLTIGARPISVAADWQSKTYGDADPSLTYVVTGLLVGGDAFIGALTRAAGEDVGPYAITQGTLALSNNYALSFSGSSLTIGARPISVAADSQSKTYGDADPVLTYTVTGSLVGSDAFIGALIRSSGESVGPYPITQGTLALSSNYVLSFTGSSLTISARSIAVAANAQSKTYGDADPSLTYVVTGLLVGSDAFSGALTRAAGEDVGPYAITQGTLALSSNYVLSFTGASLSIGKRPIAVAADAKSKTYGEADPVLSYKVTAGSLVRNDAFSGDLTRTSGENVGEYAITQGTLLLSSNYDLSFTDGKLTIDKRAVTVAAEPKTRVYGSPDPTLTYRITTGSLAFSDTFSGALQRAAGDTVGTYAIEQGSLTLGRNYDLAFEGASLTITRAPLTVSFNDATRVYGDPNPTFTGAITGVVNGDTITATYSTSATSSSGVGLYPIVASLSDPGSRLTNYDLTQGEGTLTITKAALNVTASDATKVLNAPLPALTGTLTGVKNGDDITASYATTATQASPVGEYPITATLNDPSGRLANYTVSNTSATLDVIYSTTCGRTILEPVNADGSSVFKTGRTVPAKFIVCDAAGLSIGTPGVVSSFHLVRVDYGTVSTDVSEPVTATNDMQFRWTGSHWMFNMSTSGLAPNRTYTYRIGLNDGTSIEFRFGLR